MFGSFAQIKTWMATNKDGSTRTLTNADFYKVSPSQFATQAKHIKDPACLTCIPLSNKENSFGLLLSRLEEPLALLQHLRKAL